MTIQMKATEKYFLVVLFIMLYVYMVVLAFESVNDIPMFNRLSESCSTFLWWSILPKLAMDVLWHIW